MEQPPPLTSQLELETTVASHPSVFPWKAANGQTTPLPKEMKRGTFRNKSTGKEARSRFLAAGLTKPKGKSHG